MFWREWKCRWELVDEYWDLFKTEWQLGSEETKVVFTEMKRLSPRFLQEWRIKYTFKYEHVYEEVDYTNNNVDYSKSKWKMWKEFRN